MKVHINFFVFDSWSQNVLVELMRSEKNQKGIYRYIQILDRNDSLVQNDLAFIYENVDDTYFDRELEKQMKWGDFNIFITASENLIINRILSKADENKIFLVCTSKSKTYGSGKMKGVKISVLPEYDGTEYFFTRVSAQIISFTNALISNKLPLFQTWMKKPINSKGVEFSDMFSVKIPDYLLFRGKQRITNEKKELVEFTLKRKCNKTGWEHTNNCLITVGYSSCIAFELKKRYNLDLITIGRYKSGGDIHLEITDKNVFRKLMEILITYDRVILYFNMQEMEEITFVKLLCKEIEKRNKECYVIGFLPCLYEKESLVKSSYLCVQEIIHCKMFKRVILRNKTINKNATYKENVCLLADEIIQSIG